MFGYDISIYQVVIIYTLFQAILGIFLFVSLMREFPNKNAYEWKKSKLWICCFFILTIITVCLLILQRIGVQTKVAVENRNVKLNLFLYFLLEVLKLNRCFICLVVIKMKSSDDIFQGISKLDYFIKVSCFQVYKSQGKSGCNQFLSTDTNNSR